MLSCLTKFVYNAKIILWFISYCTSNKIVFHAHSCYDFFDDHRQQQVFQGVGHTNVAAHCNGHNK